MHKILFTTFQKLSDEPLPGHLHQTIMRAVFFQRTQKILTLIAFGTSISFFFSLARLYARVIELDALNTAQSIISTIEFDIDSLTSSAHALFLATPVTSIIISLLNLIALFLTLSLMRFFKVNTALF